MYDPKVCEQPQPPTREEVCFGATRPWASYPELRWALPSSKRNATAALASKSLNS